MNTRYNRYVNDSIAGNLIDAHEKPLKYFRFKM